MQVALFDYDLPAERIAQEARPRGETRLLRLPRAAGGISLHRFDEIGKFLRPGDLLVMNDTRVIPARVFGRRASDGREFELLLSRRVGGASEHWEALAKPGRKLRPGDALDFGSGLRATLESKDGGVFTFAFSGREVLSALEEIGVVPLPPYIRREPNASRPEDRERYQTVYAREPGAVAAPTAGLHFTTEILDGVRRMGVRTATVTLAVGLGTFKPVKAGDTAEHVMEPESFVVPEETSAAFTETRRAGGRVCAVGTTTVRTLESAVRDDGTLAAGAGETRLFITPGRPFRAVDALLTNFHLPKSTLLMLVSAFAGRERILAAYERAKEEEFLFYSYGDAMWID